MFEVTFIPILVAAIASIVLAFIWYNPHVFGTSWMRIINVSPEQAERGKKRIPLTAFLAFLASMVLAYVLNYFGIAWGVYDWVGAVELGIWVWVGFVAPTMLGMVLWEMKPLRYYAIVAGYWLCTLVMMSVILVLFSA